MWHVVAAAVSLRARASALGTPIFVGPPWREKEIFVEVAINKQFNFTFLYQQTPGNSVHIVLI